MPPGLLLDGCSLPAMYKSGGPPPLEEIHWTMTTPSDFQEGTGKECPGIMIVAYLAAAEAGVTLFGPHASYVTELTTSSLHMIGTMQYRSIVLNSWPINEAFDSLQLRIREVENLLLGRQVENTTYATFVLCHEHEEPLLDWINALNPLPPRSRVLIRTPKVCDTQEPVPLVFCDSVPTCTPFNLPWKSDFVVFLPSRLETRSQHLFDLVLSSLRSMTYDVQFLHLGFQRVIPKLTACQSAVYEHVMGDKPRWLSTYSGSHMVVRGNMTEDAPPECPEGYGDALWGPLFRRSAVIPLHSEDTSLPPCFRLPEDQTILPKRQLFLESIRKTESCWSTE